MNRMIVFGGNQSIAFCGGEVNDVWVLSNANGLGGTPSWQQLSPVGGPPSRRWVHSAVYDPANNRMIVFGGGPACGSGNGEVWVLTNANGLGGTPAWTQLSPIGGPGTLASHTAVYDRGSNRMIVFGGAHPPSADIWILSNANGLGGAPTWTKLNPTGGPPPVRQNHSAVYDPATNRMTVFGSIQEDTRESWVLSNANGLGGTPTWTQLTTTGGPPSMRSAHSAVYNQASNRMTLFAGSGAAFGGLAINDLWVLTDANGVPPNNPPVANNQSVTTNEDTAVSFNLTGSDPDNNPLTFHIVSGPTNGMVTGGTGAVRTYTPNLNFFGSDSFTFKVNDGTVDSNVATVSITVTPVNDPPFFDPIGNQTVPQNAPSQSVTITGVSPGPANEAGQTVTLTATSSNTAVVPNPTISGTGASRTLTYQPVLNQNGVVTITVTANDGQAANNTFSRTFTITVLSPAQMTSNLIATVTGLNFKQGINLLQAALKHINAGNNTPACNQLNAFIKQAQAQSGKQLTVDEANQLIASANQIRVALGCP